MPAVEEESRMRRGDKSLPGPGWFNRCIYTQAGAWTSKSKHQTSTGRDLREHSDPVYR